MTTGAEVPDLHAGLTLDILQRGQIPGTEETLHLIGGDFTLRYEPRTIAATPAARGRRDAGDGGISVLHRERTIGALGNTSWLATAVWGPGNRPRHVFSEPAFSRAAGGRNRAQNPLHDRRPPHIRQL